MEIKAEMNGMDKILNLLDQKDSPFIGKDKDGKRNGKYSEQSALPALSVLAKEASGNFEKGYKRI